MSDMMAFPETVDEFMEQYKITDRKQIYTNGAELVPIFRMKQWFEHKPERKTGKWVYGSPVTVKCNQCGFYIPDWEAHSSRFCRNCGCRMLKEGEEHD
jgi:hypothetical protein